MKASNVWAALLAVGVFAAVALGAEERLAWPRFRGPGGSGVAEGQKPPVEVGPEKNVKWKVPAPPGLSSPILVGDRLVLTAFDDGKLYTIAYSRVDGKEAWRAEAPARKIEPFYKGEGSPAASTPATDGRRIVSYFGSCGLVCYDLSGKPLWKYEMDTAATAGDFGTGTSPVIAGGAVVVVRDEPKGSKILAVDLLTGQRAWETKRQSPVSYGTPVVWNTPAGPQVVAAGNGRLIGYDVKSGAEKWWVAGMPSGPCTSPVAEGDTLYFAGWSPGAADDKEFQLPKFDFLLLGMDVDKDGAVSAAEAEKTEIKAFFGVVDANKDNRITRDEWEALLKHMAEGKNAAFAVKAGGSGDVTKSHVLWQKARGLPYVPSALVYRGQVILVKDGGLVTAYDAKTGNDVYLHKRAAASGRYYASPVAANGNIYFVSLDDGAVTVLKAGADKPEAVAENPPLGERTAATPAIADDTLYVRTEKHLYAFSEKK